MKEERNKDHPEREGGRYRLAENEMEIYEDAVELKARYKIGRIMKTAGEEKLGKVKHGGF